MRRQTEALCQRHRCPYIIHLEDNEEFIFSAFTNIPLAQTATISAEELDQAAGEGLSHPVRYRRFLAGASGVTTIIQTLVAFVPEGIPTEEIWPGYDEELFYPQSGDIALRNKLGIPDGAYVVAYAGNAHAANAAEMHSLYSAIGLVNRQGHPLKLIRCSRDSVDLLSPELHFIKEHIVDVGFQPHIEVPRYLALADFLVQPGRANDFNDFRIPSKLPEFLAMGLPVILPRSNIGREMRHEVDALIMEEGHNLDIARQLRRLIGDPPLRERIGAGGRAFAERHLNWNVGAAKLFAFYERVLGRNIGNSQPPQHAARSAAAVEPTLLKRRYGNFHAAPLSYATVADYVDSVEHLPDLAQSNRDIKDVQRPWALKALLASVPAGGRVLEIGAGEPLVAQRLVDLGYEVVVVDPYEGYAGGPSDFEIIYKSHPRITFMRGHFPQAVPANLTGSFDAIYSISVLEHVPLTEINLIFAGIKRLLRHPGCASIHAIDHVHRGRGSEYHLTMLQRVTAAAGLSQSVLDQVLLELDEDPEAYFLSAEAHNRWRGSAPYAEFPMRRVVSIQLCTQAGMIGVGRKE
ncbi:MAG TPA: methyltransferase domain-containing protein [Stellaceae bacterium]|nr:methyltransferase domain-containing protein [Stellaceae bacterium]